MKLHGAERVRHALDEAIIQVNTEARTPNPTKECTSCRGYGHFDNKGRPSVDKRDRKCLDCLGEGHVAVNT